MQVLYVVYFDRNGESEVIRALSITELLLAHPCLSLAVFNSKPSVCSRAPDTPSPAQCTGTSEHVLVSREVHGDGRVCTDRGKSWNMSHIFQAWKVVDMRIAGVTNFSMISK